MFCVESASYLELASRLKPLLTTADIPTLTRALSYQIAQDLSENLDIHPGESKKLTALLNAPILRRSVDNLRRHRNRRGSSKRANTTSRAHTTKTTDSGRLSRAKQIQTQEQHETQQAFMLNVIKAYDILNRTTQALHKIEQLNLNISHPMQQLLDIQGHVNALFPQNFIDALIDYGILSEDDKTWLQDFQITIEDIDILNTPFERKTIERYLPPPKRRVLTKNNANRPEKLLRLAVKLLILHSVYRNIAIQDKWEKQRASQRYNSSHTHSTIQSIEAFDPKELLPIFFAPETLNALADIETQTASSRKQFQHEVSNETELEFRLQGIENLTQKVLIGLIEEFFTTADSIYIPTNSKNTFSEVQITQLIDPARSFFEFIEAGRADNNAAATQGREKRIRYQYDGYDSAIFKRSREIKKFFYDTEKDNFWADSLLHALYSIAHKNARVGLGITPQRQTNAQTDTQTQQPPAYLSYVSRYPVATLSNFSRLFLLEQYEITSLLEDYELNNPRPFTHAEETTSADIITATPEPDTLANPKIDTLNTPDNVKSINSKQKIIRIINSGEWKDSELNKLEVYLQQGLSVRYPKHQLKNGYIQSDFEIIIDCNFFPCDADTTKQPLSPLTENTEIPRHNTTSHRDTTGEFHAQLDSVLDDDGIGNFIDTLILSQNAHPAEHTIPLNLGLLLYLRNIHSQFNTPISKTPAGYKTGQKNSQDALMPPQTIKPYGHLKQPNSPIRTMLSYYLSLGSRNQLTQDDIDLALNLLSRINHS